MKSIRSLLLGKNDYEEYSGRDFDKDQTRFTVARNKRRCAYCGKRNPFTKDHVIPKSKGGSNDLSNLVWCCMSCNSRKGPRTPEDAGMVVKFPEESRVE